MMYFLNVLRDPNMKKDYLLVLSLPTDNGCRETSFIEITTLMSRGSRSANGFK